MTDFTSTELVIIILAFFAGGLLKGILGIALPAVALAVMVQILPPLTAATLMVLPVLMSNFWQAVQGGTADIGRVIHRYIPVIASCLISITVVSLYAVYLPSVWVLLAVGVTLILFGSANLFAPHMQLPAKWDLPAAILGGFLGGVVGGATTAYGPPINIYLVSLRLDKQAWVKAVGVIYSICGLPLLVGYSINGMLTVHMATLSALACLPAFAGIWLGTSIRHLIAQDLFRKILLWFLLCTGFSMIWRALS